MTLANAIATYVNLKQSMGMRFRNEDLILKALHRRVGDVDLNEVTPDAVAAFLAGHGPITATWLNKASSTPPLLPTLDHAGTNYP
jgi:integrase/recombinase XerD